MIQMFVMGFQILVAGTVQISHAKKQAKIYNPDQGKCRESWVQETKNNASVQLNMQFIDKDGNVIAGKNGKTSSPYCSGSLVKIGDKLQIATAGHCGKDNYRPNGSWKIVRDPKDPNSDKIPPEAVSMRIVAKVAGKDPEVPISSIQGPKMNPSMDDKMEYFRSNDYAVFSANQEVLSSIAAGKKIPSICDENILQKGIDASVVIGYGVTNLGNAPGDNTPNRVDKPLCAEQKIDLVQNGIIVIDRFQKNGSGACPGDSGGGLWYQAKTGEPCLAGVVSGPRTNSIKKVEGPQNPLDNCSQEGLQAIYASVYTQQADVNKYAAQGAAAAAAQVGDSATGTVIKK